jgi:type I restriction enzyme, S subunit
VSEWPSATVAELQADRVLFVEDGNHGEQRPRPNEFEAGGTPFIRAADLQDGRVLFEASGEINEIARNRIRKGIGQPGDILFSHKGTVGKLARVDMDAPPFVCSPQTTLWRTLDSRRLDAGYLYAFMRTRAFIDQWWVRKGDTDMADYVSLTAQRQLRIVLPPLGIQRRIAAPIAAIDDLIDNNRQRMTLLEQSAQAIYREWFVRFRYPGHEDDELVDSVLGSIPESWSATVIGAVADVNRAQRKPHAGESIVYIDISALGDRSVVVPTAMNGAEAPGRARRVLADGDIVWSMVRPGRRAHALLMSVGSDWIGSTGLAVITPRDVPSSFLYETVSRQEFSDYLVGKEGGAAYPAVKPVDYEEALFALPSRSVLALFEQAVSPLYRLNWGLMEQNRVIAETRDLVLPKLVTGTIDVSKLDLDALLEEQAG